MGVVLYWSLYFACASSDLSSLVPRGEEEKESLVQTDHKSAHCAPLLRSAQPHNKNSIIEANIISK